MPASLTLTPDELLTTTRAVRRRLDLSRPVERSVLLECIAIAQQAPVASNLQHWHFVVVTDEAKKAALADLYRKAVASYQAARSTPTAATTGDPARDRAQERVAASAAQLIEHLHECPALVIPCVERRPGGVERPVAAMLGSILPAAWSFMLAARARELGTCWTTVHLLFEEQAAEIIGIPFSDVAQAMMTPVAYTIGNDFKPALRPDPATITHFDSW